MVLPESSKKFNNKLNTNFINTLIINEMKPDLFA